MFLDPPKLNTVVAAPQNPKPAQKVSDSVFEDWVSFPLDNSPEKQLPSDVMQSEPVIKEEKKDEENLR